MLLLALVVTPFARAQDAPPTGAVFGFVTDASGNPLAGATITVADLADVAAVAGDDGSFGLTLPAGDHVLLANTPALTSDGFLVSVPADDTAFVSIAATNAAPPPPEQPTPTPIPEPTVTPVPPTVTPVRPSPTATSIPTASLSGNVKNPDGSQPIGGTTVLVLDLPGYQASTGNGGAYVVAGLPLGRHVVIASDLLGAVSDRYQVPLSGDATLNISLQRFPGGNPTLFVGHVLSGSNRSAVAGATVWRFGGAGITTSSADGRFQLVDASRGSPDPNSSQLGRAPDAVTFVAVKDDQWGMLRPDPNNPGRLENVLDQQSTPPPAPHATPFRDGMSVTDRGEQYFTAKWRNSNNARLDGIEIHIKRADGSDDFNNGNGFGNCVGDCGGGRPNGFVIKLPRNQNVTLEAWDEIADKPWKSTHSDPLAWDEAQVVRLP